MNLLQNNFKRMKGQVASVMNLVIAFCVVLLVGIFAFEFTRYLLARDELKTNVEVAALSCQTTLASSGDPTSATNQNNAKQTGLQLFKQNSILGQPMSTANLAPADASVDLSPGQAQISFQFLDPLTRQPVNASGAGVMGSAIDPAAAGTLIQATGSYCYSPAFGQFIGMSNAQFVFSVSALAGVPKIDLMVLLDISGGMDDDTSVSYYQRYQGTNGTNWMIPNSSNGPNGIASGTNTTIWCSGRPANILPPCELEVNGTCLQYSELPSVPNSNGLDGYLGTPPPPWCGPVSFIPSNKKLIANAKNKHSHFFKSKIAMTKKRVLSKNNDPGLIDICQKITGKQATNKLIEKTLISQLDDKFSKVSFKPRFDLFPASAQNSSTSAGTSGVNNTIYDPANLVPPISTYTGSDNMQYVPLSHMPGSGQGPAFPPPTGSANGCAITGYGAAAATVYTGIVCNGTVGASNPNNPNMTINNIATAIEASLGDLESAQNAANAGIATSALGVTPQVGWYAFYYVAARQFLQPMMSILNGLIGFINEMSIISDIHYGFIAFNDNIGSAPNSVSAPVNNVSSLFNFTTPNADGSSSVSNTYPLPNIPLSSTNSNQANIINTMPNLSVWGNRNVTQSLTAAASQLQTNGRPGANQAILLITCGAPSGSDSASAAIAEATTLGQSGIPVYVICASLNNSEDTLNDAAYNDSAGSNAGVAGASGHGAKYFRIDYVDPTTTQNQLVTIFGNMARRLVSIVPNS